MKKSFIILFIWLFLPLNSNANVNSFIYQLQNTKFQNLLDVSFDIAVIDIDDANLSLDQINSLKDQDKKIVSYLSIGEAENYRDYWTNGDFDNNPPDFIEEENPDFEGNFKVEYWDPEWQNIIFNRLDEIIDAGYDGVYLDIIDAYFYFEQKGRETARDEMEDFVIEIARRSREKNKEFLIIPQNAPELVEDEKYFSVIDGLGKEDTFFFDDRKIKNKIVKQDLFYLNKITESGKFVLATDYPVQLNKQCKFFKLARKNKLIPFVSNRDLNIINIPACNNQ